MYSSTQQRSWDLSWRGNIQVTNSWRLKPSSLQVHLLHCVFSRAVIIANVSALWWRVEQNAEKKYCYILLSTFNWNLKEVLLLHTSETPRMSSKPLCEAAALSAILFSFPSICCSISLCIRQRSDVDFLLEKPLLPKLKKNLQDCHLWNSLTCYSETLWVEKEGNHYLPVTHPPAHFPPVYSPESADFSLSPHKGRMQVRS